MEKKTIQDKIVDADSTVNGINSFYANENSAQTFLHSIHLLGAVTMATPPLGVAILSFSLTAQSILDKAVQNIKLNILIQEVLEGINYLLKMDIIKDILETENKDSVSTISDSSNNYLKKNIENKIKYHLGGLTSLLLTVQNKRKTICNIGNNINKFLSAESIYNEIINRMVLLNFFLTIELLRISSLNNKNITQDEDLSSNISEDSLQEKKNSSDLKGDYELSGPDDEYETSRESLKSLDDLEEEEQIYVKNSIQVKMNTEYYQLDNTYSQQAENYIQIMKDKINEKQNNFCKKMVNKIKSVFSNKESTDEKSNPPLKKSFSFPTAFKLSSKSSKKAGNKKKKKRKTKNTKRKRQTKKGKFKIY